MNKHYLIYQITNNVNGKIYIGKHETFNVDDNYFGSGKYLKRAIKKYGFDKFVKTILFECQNKEEMDLLEKCVVTQEFCDRDDTYNINVGGDGGWSYVNTQKLYIYADKTSDKYQQFIVNLTIKNRKNALKRKEKQKTINAKISKSLNKHYENYHGENRGKWKWSDRQRNLLKYAQCGSRNSQFGKKWIHNDMLKISFPVNENFLYDYISEGYVLGRVRKYIHK